MRAVRLARQTGVEASARQVGCSRPSLYRWLAAFEAEGIGSLVGRLAAAPPFAPEHSRLGGSSDHHDPPLRSPGSDPRWRHALSGRRATLRFKRGEVAWRTYVVSSRLSDKLSGDSSWRLPASRIIRPDGRQPC